MQPKPTSPSTDSPESRARDDALDWFVRRQNEAFRATEELQFQCWLKSDPYHGTAFSFWQAEWQAFEQIPPDLRAALVLRESRNWAAASPARASPAARRPTRRTLLPAFALSGLIAATSISGVMAWRHWQAQPSYTGRFSSAQGEFSDVPLPDGSRVRLDTATTLDVAFYRDHREVRLRSGQAVFAVQAEPDRPFRVQAGSLKVTAVGTRFSVRFTPDIPGADGVRVAVEEGVVRVEPADGLPRMARPAMALLTGGQQVAGNAEGKLSPVRAVHGTGMAPWQNRRLVFENIPLAHALAELARYGATRLVITDPAVAELRVSGVFDPQDLKAFKRMLPLSLPVRLEPTGGVELITAR